MPSHKPSIDNTQKLSSKTSDPEEKTLFRTGDVVSVLLPLPFTGGYDYSIPEGIEVMPGHIVRVPFGKRTVHGSVWGPGTANLTADAIKPIFAVYSDLPPLPPVTRRFIEWVAGWTLAPCGAILKMTLPNSDLLEPSKARTLWRWNTADTIPNTITMTPARRKVLALFTNNDTPASLSEIAAQAGTSQAVLRGLISRGLLTEAPPAPPQSAPLLDGTQPGPCFSPDQQQAVEILRQKINAGYNCTVLEGVTGSGKTDVYFDTIAAALQEQHQVLVLLPEIVLTEQWLQRFKKRFGAMPHQWHSHVTNAQKRSTWQAVLNGSAQVVVGARSALFLPWAHLGLLIVDEEHESAFKQEDGVIYHGRDMAVARAHLGQIPIILASATPSLETVINVREKRYQHVCLRERYGPAKLPQIDLIDMRTERPEPVGVTSSWISPPLVTQIARALENREQVLLYLNRRGYAPLTLCRSCGHRLQCPHCTAWLVEHRYAQTLLCHHCGHHRNKPQTCPSCKKEDDLYACGPGVERIEEEIACRFPDARRMLVTSDTLSRGHTIETFVRKMTERQVDILIGTQILAKGFHFPYLTLVGVIDADLGLIGGDLRAAEKTYQMLYQVAGRSGRAEHPGRVMLQTYHPTHPVLQALASGDPCLFLDTEAEARKALGMPPFGRLISLIVSGPHEQAVAQTARDIAYHAPSGNGIDILGPAPAPLFLLRKKYRWRLLIKAPRSTRLQHSVQRWLSQIALPRNVRVQVDVDPYTFL